MKQLDKRVISVGRGGTASVDVDVETFELASTAGGAPVRFLRATCGSCVVERSWTLRANSGSVAPNAQKLGLPAAAPIGQVIQAQLQKELDAMRDALASDAAFQHDVADAAKSLV